MSKKKEILEPTPERHARFTRTIESKKKEILEITPDKYKKSMAEDNKGHLSSMLYIRTRYKGDKWKPLVLEAQKALFIVDEYVDTIDFFTENKEIKINCTLSEKAKKEGITLDKIISELSSDVVLRSIDFLLNSSLYFQDEEKLHRQPRNYLKTAAMLVAKNTNGDTLFTVPQLKLDESSDINRQELSKNTIILGQLLLKLYQESGQEELEIKNLSLLAKKMNNTNYEIKMYLLNLGGYTLPILDKNQKGFTLSIELLFNIKFQYSKKTEEKHMKGETEIIGTKYAQIIKNEPLESVIIKPNIKFIKALDGEGLGNVLTTDGYFALALSLTPIAYKILCYSSSNRPSQTIGEKNLIKHLKLEKQVSAQGKTRIRATILKALKELQDKGHINSYSFKQLTEMYSYTYSDKYIKHSETSKQSKQLKK